MTDVMKIFLISSGLMGDPGMSSRASLSFSPEIRNIELFLLQNDTEKLAKSHYTVQLYSFTILLKKEKLSNTFTIPPPHLIYWIRLCVNILFFREKFLR